MTYGGGIPGGSLPLNAALAGVQDMRSAGGSDSGGGADHFSHAAGRICKNCDGRIENRQPARRKADGDWGMTCAPIDRLTGSGDGGSLISHRLTGRRRTGPAGCQPEPDLTLCIPAHWPDKVH